MFKTNLSEQEQKQIEKEFYKTFENGTEQRDLEWLEEYEQPTGENNGTLWKFKGKYYIFNFGTKHSNYTNHCNGVIFDNEQDALALGGYKLYEINQLQKIWDNSCSLRFINNWKLNKTFVRQFEDATFED